MFESQGCGKGVGRTGDAVGTVGKFCAVAGIVLVAVNELEEVTDVEVAAAVVGVAKLDAVADPVAVTTVT
jgi:hypothetical protein